MFNDEAFTAAIRNVAAGGTVLDPEVVGKLMTGAPAPSRWPG